MEQHHYWQVQCYHVEWSQDHLVVWYQDCFHPVPHQNRQELEWYHNRSLVHYHLLIEIVIVVKVVSSVRVVTSVKGDFVMM